MKPVFFLILIPFLTPLAGADDLPFNREIINRHSLDKLPRSLSVRQGTDIWLGYDLERAKVFKTWQAPAGKPGLIQSEVDADYLRLRQSILDPNALLVDGYPENLMPPITAIFTEAQIEALVEFVVRVGKTK